MGRGLAGEGLTGDVAGWFKTLFVLLTLGRCRSLSCLLVPSVHPRWRRRGSSGCWLSWRN